MHRTKSLIEGEGWGGMQSLKRRNMEIDILTLAKEHPGTIISVTLDDLRKATDRLIHDLRIEFESEFTRKNEVTYLTTEEVSKKLNVTLTTLWRWAKRDYLVPVNIGGQRRYKSTDIEDILEGRK